LTIKTRSMNLAGLAQLTTMSTCISADRTFLVSSRYQKGKTNLDFTEARDSEWQWHQLGHMQVCTSLQTDNHANTPPLSFYRPDALPAAQPTASKHWTQMQGWKVNAKYYRKLTAQLDRRWRHMEHCCFTDDCSRCYKPTIDLRLHLIYCTKWIADFPTLDKFWSDFITWTALKKLWSIDNAARYLVSASVSVRRSEEGFVGANWSNDVAS